MKKNGLDLKKKLDEIVKHHKDIRRIRRKRDWSQIPGDPENTTRMVCEVNTTQWDWDPLGFLPAK